MVSYPVVLPRPPTTSVLILVLMEDGLVRHEFKWMETHPDMVLILVLMEDGLVQCRWHGEQERKQS